MDYPEPYEIINFDEKPTQLISMLVMAIAELDCCLIHDCGRHNSRVDPHYERSLGRCYASACDALAVVFDLERNKMFCCAFYFFSFPRRLCLSITMGHPKVLLLWESSNFNIKRRIDIFGSAECLGCDKGSERGWFESSCLNGSEFEAPSTLIDRPESLYWHLISWRDRVFFRAAVDDLL